MPRSDYPIRVDGLRKRYRDTVALDDFHLAVPRGMVYGLLGPNGAGKTTAVRILTTLLRPDGGRAEIAGYDLRTQPRLIRHRIGLTGQQTAVDELISARQNLVMFGRLFHLSKVAARQRADELLHRFGLADVADKAPKTFSGGMRRRLDLASSMILAPEVLFLDEPTTGLDPAGRREVWEEVAKLATAGTTVLLTTHYLDEADKLCDRIGVIDQGRNLVEDTPAGLKRRIGNDRLEVVAAEPADLESIVEVLRRAVPDGPQPALDRTALSASVAVADGVRVLTEVAVELRQRGIVAADLGLRRPTLDEAFLQLTGDAPGVNPEPAKESVA